MTPEKRSPTLIGTPLVIHEALLLVLGLGGAAAFSLCRLWMSSNGNLGRLTFPDEMNCYYPAAQAIRAQGLGFFLTERSLWVGPLNPLWIATWGARVALVKAANVALLSAVAFLLWHAVRGLFGKWAGILALASFGFYPIVVSLGPTILTEPPFIFLLAASFYIFARNEEERWQWDLAAGILLGLATLVRPTLQLAPLALAALALVYGRRQAGSHIVRRAMAVLIGAYLLVVPYVVKNYWVFGRPAIANGLGAVLYLGSDLRKDGNEPVFSGMEYDTGKVTEVYNHLQTEGDRRLIKAALASMRRWPLDTLLLTVKKLVRYLYPGGSYYFFPYQDLASFLRRSPAEHSAVMLWELCLSTLIVTAGLAGLALLKLRPALRIFLMAFVFYLIALHALTFPTARLSLPAFLLLLVPAAGFLVKPPSRRLRAVVLALSAFIVGWVCSYGYFFPNWLVSRRYVSYFTLLREIPPQSYVASPQVLSDSGDFKSAGASPALVYQFEPLKTDSNQVLFISLAAWRENLKRRSWVPLEVLRAGAEQDFSQPQALTIALDGKEHTYRLVFPASGPKPTVARLKLNLVRRAPDVRYRLSQLEIRQ